MNNLNNLNGLNNSNKLNYINNIKVLKTKRLILDLPNDNQASDVLESAKNENVTKFLTWQNHKKIEDSLDFIEFAKILNKNKNAYIWMVKERNTNKVIGSIGLLGINNGNNEIGYWLGEDYWGKGYGTEMLEKVISFVKENNKDIKYIVGKHFENNLGSGQVMLNNGFVKQEDSDYAYVKGNTERLSVYKLVL